ncbi:MAG: PQQ-binding-like beta-propeller repeat protein [Elusimicrobiota bacterium]|nr:PQQ-binding-like beta-propeller repeat protein [Elusimicrobiota bacterium]
MKKIIWPLLLLAVCAPVLLVGNAQAGAKLWEKKLSGKILWKQFHSAGVVLAVTDSELLYGLDPRTGNELYKIEDLAKNITAPDDPPGSPFVLEGTPYILIVTKAGMIKPEILKLVNAADGKVVWEGGTTIPAAQLDLIMEGKKFKETPEFRGAAMIQPIFDPAHDQVIVTYRLPVLWAGKAGYSKVARRGTAIAGYDVKTGKINFAYFPGEDIDNSTVCDFPPVVSGDTGVIDWFGMHSFSVVDGKPLGSVKFARALKAGMLSRYRYLKTSAGPVIDGDDVYIVVKEHIEAYDLKTGQKKWASADLDSAIPEFQASGDKLVAKIGGVFCTWAAKPECREFFPYGLAVLDKGTGKVLAKSGEVDKKNGKAMTSSLVIDNNIAYHGVSNGARAFDLSTLTYKWMTSIGKTADGDEAKLVQVADGKVVLLNTQATAAFNAADGKLLWSKVVPTVTMDLAMRMAQSFASVAAFASGVEAGKQGGVINQNQTISRWESTDAGFANMMKQVSLADAKGRYNYSMTGKSKNAVIAGVNTKTGELDRGAQVEGRVPDYMVDPVTGILVNVSKSDPKWIMGFDMNAPLPDIN